MDALVLIIRLNIILCPVEWIYNCLVASYSGTKKLEDQIYSEIRGRLKEDDISAPLRRGPYYYYRRTLEGKEYAQHCRRLVANIGTQASVYDTMQTGPDAPPEHVLLDENVKAQEHAFYSIGAFKARLHSLLVSSLFHFYIFGVHPCIAISFLII